MSYLHSISLSFKLIYYSPTNYPEEPAFLDDDGPSDDLSPTTTNARELYGLRPGETVPEAIERKAREG
jgi:hypothetical protein